MDNNIRYFNLNKDGDTAIVRLLHSGVKTIEHVSTHYTDISGKKKNVKCCGEGCPICARNEQPSNRIYIHLWDYTDDSEKVWSRTDKIIPQLAEVEESWGNLSECVLRITRVGNDFPKYTVVAMPPNKYHAVSSAVDEKISYRFYLSRSVDELKEYYETGIMPVHKSTFVPKEEYFKNKEKTSAPDEHQKVNVDSISDAQVDSFSDLPFSMENDDPFADPFLATKRFN